MSSRSLVMIGIFLWLPLVGCASGDGEPFEETWEIRHKHSFDFMWEQAILALEDQYDIATADRESATITTDWNTNLAVFSHKGQRTRLIVTLDGDVVDGFTVKVTEEREINTEQVDPLVESEADWEPDVAEGGSAGRFRVALYRRLNPRQDWLDEAGR